MKHLALALLLTACSYERSLTATQGAPAPPDGTTATDASPFPPVDAADPIIANPDAPPWNWQETTTVGTANVGGKIFEHGANVYFGGNPIVAISKTTGATAAVATPLGTPTGVVYGDADGFVYVATSGDVIAQPWSGAPVVVGTAPANTSELAADATSVYALGQLQLVRFPRAGGGAAIVVHTAADLQCSMFGPFVVDGTYAYFTSLYTDIPGCLSTTAPPPYQYVARVPLAGGPRETAPIAALYLEAAGGGALFGLDDNGPVRAAGGVTAPIYATVLGGMSVAAMTVHGGFVYWSGMQIPVGFLNESEVACAPVGGGAATVLSRGPGTTMQLVVDDDHAYFTSWCDDTTGACGDGHLRSVPSCH